MLLEWRLAPCGASYNDAENPHHGRRYAQASPDRHGRLATGGRHGQGEAGEPADSKSEGGSGDDTERVAAGNLFDAAIHSTAERSHREPKGGGYFAGWREKRAGGEGRR
jgi:hypothetical protein